jgi:hypothetical protein
MELSSSIAQPTISQLANIIDAFRSAKSIYAAATFLVGYDIIISIDREVCLDGNSDRARVANCPHCRLNSFGLGTRTKLRKLCTIWSVTLTRVEAVNRINSGSIESFSPALVLRVSNPPSRGKSLIDLQ